MDSVITNSASNTCPNPISSNCVFVPGPCGPQTLTQQLQTITSSVASAASCCTGTFPPGNSSGYTGNWIDFTPTIPTAGTGVGYNWVLVNFGCSFNGATTPGGVTGLENKPSYYWTQQGDLRIRGSMTIGVNPIKGGQGGLTAIPLVALNTANFPTNFTASQSHLIGTTASAQAPGTPVASFIFQATRAFLTIDFPSGILYLNYDYVDTQGTNITENLFFGGTIFNLS